MSFMLRSINTETFIACDTEYRQSDTVIFGAPFDGTTSFRPGTRFGPSAMRKDSFGIETWSPYQEKDLLDARICDVGDLDLPFGSTQKILGIIEEQTNIILTDKKTPVMLGGEHLVTLGAVRAVYKHFNNLSIIHLDAHADLREEYLSEHLSHASVMRRCWDILGDGKIHQFGIRSGDRDEFAFAKLHTHLCPFNLDGIKATADTLKNQDIPVYLTLDLDVLDPSIFPGTGTPEAGGASFSELLDALLLLKGLNIVAFDVNELSPHYDPSGTSTAVACKILRELLLLIR